MRRWLSLLLAVATACCAPAARAGEQRPACVIPLRGQLDEFLVESFHQRVRQALSPPAGPAAKGAEAPAAPGLVLFDLHTTNGSLDMALSLATEMRQLSERKVETAALIHPPDSAANTLLALACDRFFMASDASLAPLDPAVFEAAGPDGQKRLLDAMDLFSKARPRLQAFYRMLVDPTRSVYAVLLKGKPYGFYTKEEHQRLKESPSEKIVRYEVFEAGSRPELTAEDAERLGVSAGTAASIGAVATELGLSGASLRFLEQKGSAEAGHPTIAVEEAAPARLKPIGTGDTVVFILLDGMVGEGMLHSLERRLREAEKLDPALLVFEMDTYGGMLAPALKMADTIFNLKKPRTVAYVNDKAISAGALISVSCDQIVMQHGSELGDCEVVTGSGEELHSEKIDTVLRARFRTFCTGKYPLALAQAMVTTTIEVYQVKTRDGKTEYLEGTQWDALTPVERERYVSYKKILGSDRLLTMTDTEAKEYGFSSATVESRQEVLDFFGLDGRTIVVLDWNWSELLVRWLDEIGPVLLALGILGIIIELKTPGFGLPGIAGLLLIALFFFGKHAAGLAETWQVLLFGVGVALLAVELFVTPGFGVLGILGILAMVASVLLSLQPFIVPRSPVEWRMFERNVTSIGAVALSVFLGVLLIGRYLHHAPYLGKIVLPAPPPSTAPTAVAESISPPPSPQQEERREGELVGRQGRALSMLRPAGRADFDGVPIDVVTEGDFISPGEPVEIYRVRGNRTIVKRRTTT